MKEDFRDVYIVALVAAVAIFIMLLNSATSGTFFSKSLSGEAYATEPIEQTKKSIPTNLKNQVPSGCCQDGDECHLIGTRLDKNDFSLYCGLDISLRVQKPKGTVCNRGFECNSNVCVNSYCT